MLGLPELQRMYDSEINFRIDTLWDGGFHWYLGDEMNGYKKDGYTLTLGEAVAKLCLAAHSEYPDSRYHLGDDNFERLHPEWFTKGKTA